MVDNVALGRQGEIFVMQKLMKRGWEFPKDYHENLGGLDWVFEKDERIIKIQVKTCLKKFITFSVKGKEDFDYLIITNLKRSWIIPKLIYVRTNRLTKTFKLLQEKYDLVDLEGYNLINAVNDCKIPYGMMNKAILMQKTKSFKR